MPTAHLSVLVVNHQQRVHPHARVVARRSPDHPWRTLIYDDALSRYRLDDVEPGVIELQIDGPPDWDHDQLVTELAPGHNRARATIAPRGTRSFPTADGSRMYFEPITDWSPPGGRVDKRFAPLRVANGSVLGLSSDLIVRFVPETPIAVREAIAARAGMTVVRREIRYLGTASVFRRAGAPDLDMFRRAEELQNEEPVLDAEPDLGYYIKHHATNAQTPNDFLYPLQGPLRQTRVGEAWARLPKESSFGSPEVVVAVFDPEGVDSEHRSLIGTFADGKPRRIANWDFTGGEDQRSATIDRSHGTQCASTAVGGVADGEGTAGVAGNCCFIGARLPEWVTGLELADAWVWAAGLATGREGEADFPPSLERGADVLSNSWGADDAPLTAVVRDAIDYLTLRGRQGEGCVICFSAGNIGHEDFALRYPLAAYERVLAIGASISDGVTVPCNSDHAYPDNVSGSQAELRLHPDTRACYSPYGEALDLVAPSSTAYFHGDIVDPTLAPELFGMGDLIAKPLRTAKIVSPALVGAHSIVLDQEGQFANDRQVMIGRPGDPDRELVTVGSASNNLLSTLSAARSITAGNVTVDSASNNLLSVSPLRRPHPAETPVLAGDWDYSLSFGGTSYATALVAGGVALILSANPGLKWRHVFQILRASARQIDPDQDHLTGAWRLNDDQTRFSRWYGFGCLDLAEAVRLATSENVPEAALVTTARRQK